MLDRSDSPWYPTMRLFRQRTRDDWRGVFSDIEYALRGLLRAQTHAIRPKPAVDSRACGWIFALRGVDVRLRRPVSRQSGVVFMAQGRIFGNPSFSIEVVESIRPLQSAA